MNLPIAFLDSGGGGLTVVKEAMRQLPNESLIYIGDNARCPYGPRPEEEVSFFTNQLVDFLVKQGAKMLVIACNTASAVCLEEVRKRLDIPVIGMIQPGARAANKATRKGRIGILGTQGTIESGAYQEALWAKNNHLELFPLACPAFVPLVESHQYQSSLAKKLVAETLADLRKKDLDTLILGCTHFPLLEQTIQHVMGKEVTLIDSGAEAVSELSILLDYLGLAESRPGHAKQHFYTTGSVRLFKEIGQDWLGREMAVKQVKLTDL